MVMPHDTPTHLGALEVDGAQVGFLKATYDFAVHGGAISTIGLGKYLPDNAVIIDGIVDVVTTLTSSGDTATVSVNSEGAGDLVAAIAINDVSNPWDAGLQAIIPDGTDTNAIKLTDDREIAITVAVQALTAGKFHVLLRYFVTD